MKKLLIGVCLLFAVCTVQAQIPSSKQLVADETWIISSGKSSFRVITSNDSISKLLQTKFGGTMTRFTYSQKKDRHGPYWERSFYFRNEDWNGVVLFINCLK